MIFQVSTPKDRHRSRARARIFADPLLARLESALERNRKLTEENQRLRRQLAHALGDRRAEPTGSPGD
jgi:regulator of replication initiation timing